MTAAELTRGCAGELYYSLSQYLEGCAGTTLNYETHKEEPAYQKYAKQMTDEVVAVCEAALAAGVDEIVVKDDTEMPPTLM